LNDIAAAANRETRNIRRTGGSGLEVFVFRESRYVSSMIPHAPAGQTVPSRKSSVVRKMETMRAKETGFFSKRGLWVGVFSET
jgi:hypothetical protein